jgi:hypothetical protein
LQNRAAGQGGSARGTLRETGGCLAGTRCGPIHPNCTAAVCAPSGSEAFSTRSETPITNPFRRESAVRACATAVSPHNGCIHAFRFAFGLRFIVTAFGRDEGQSPRKIMTTFVNVTLQVPVDTDGKLLLPDNLCVGRDLYLRGEAITALPNNLSVPGDLSLSHGRQGAAGGPEHRWRSLSAGHCDQSVAQGREGRR